jgi:hypothetical protein
MRPEAAIGEDESILVFDEANSVEYRGADALHFNGDAVNIASLASGGQKLAINFLPEVDDATEILLDIAAQKSGSYNITFNTDEYAGYPLTLKDNYLGKETPIAPGMVYRFDIDKSNTKTFGAGRFSINGSSAAVLPVRLLSFTGKVIGTGVQLTWATSFEANNKIYQLYRACNDSNYQLIGEVLPKGPSTYNFTDALPEFGHNYYKLVQIDFDGKETEIGQISVNFSVYRSSNTFVFPNPVVNRFTVDIDGLPANTYKLSLYDLMGKQINTFKASAQELKNGYSIDASSIGAGLFFLRVIAENTGDLVAVEKLLKK